MDKIRIQSFECIICRKSITEQLLLEKTDKYYVEPTKAEQESCLLKLLHVNPKTILSKFQEEEEISHGDETSNVSEKLAKSYCRDCCKRNHDIFDLVNEIYRFNLKLGKLREVVKTEFKKSFAVGEDESLELGLDKSGEEILRRKKSVRYEIAVGLNLINEQELDPEALQYVNEDDGGDFSDRSSPEPASVGSDVQKLPDQENDVSRSSPGSRHSNRSKRLRNTSPVAISELSQLTLPELKQRFNLIDFSIMVQRLPPMTTSTVDVNTLENDFGYQPMLTKLSAVNPQKNLDFLDEIMLGVPSSPENVSEEDEEYVPEESDTRPKPRRGRARRQSGSKGPRRRRKKTDDPVRFFCPFEGCSKQKFFTTKAKLEYHTKKIHEGVARPFECNECESSFADEHGLRRHIEFVHRQTRGHLCNICGRKFMDTHNLRNHVLAHSSDRTMQCPECDHSFKHEKSLKVHIKRVHRNERPHSCDRCGKSFHTGHKLKNHIQSIHFPNDKPFICEICGMGFPIQGYLYMHKRLKHKREGEEANQDDETNNTKTEGAGEDSSEVPKKRKRPQVKKIKPSIITDDHDDSFEHYSNMISTDELLKPSVSISTGEIPRIQSDIPSPQSSRSSTCPIDLSQLQSEASRSREYSSDVQNQDVHEVSDLDSASTNPTAISYSTFVHQHFLS